MSFHMDIIDKLQIGHLKIYNLFGFPVLDVTMDDLVGIAERAIDGKIRVLTGQINGPTLVRMQRDYELKRSFHESDIYFADGGGIVFASQLMGKKLPERVTGIDLMMKLMELAHRRKFTVYLLGAKQEVVEETVEVFARDYPDARVEYRNGYFTDDEEQGIAETIRDSGADMLFVGITTPKKENFLARWGDFVGVPFLHGVGGAFDVVAGKVETVRGGSSTRKRAGPGVHPGPAPGVGLPHLPGAEAHVAPRGPGQRLLRRSVRLGVGRGQDQA